MAGPPIPVPDPPRRQDRPTRLVQVPASCVEWGVDAAGKPILPAVDENAARVMAAALNRQPGNRLQHHAVMRVTTTPWRRI